MVSYAALTKCNDGQGLVLQGTGTTHRGRPREPQAGLKVPFGMDKDGSICIIEYYSIIKKKEIMSFAAT